MREFKFVTTKELGRQWWCCRLGWSWISKCPKKINFMVLKLTAVVIILVEWYSGVGGAVKTWQISVVQFHFDRGFWSALLFVLKSGWTRTTSHSTVLQYYPRSSKSPSCHYTTSTFCSLTQATTFECVRILRRPFSRGLLTRPVECCGAWLTITYIGYINK
jgi:hypothetical protein